MFFERARCRILRKKPRVTRSKPTLCIFHPTCGRRWLCLSVSLECILAWRGQILSLRSLWQSSFVLRAGASGNEPSTLSSTSPRQELQQKSQPLQRVSREESVSHKCCRGTLVTRLLE